MFVLLISTNTHTHEHTHTGILLIGEIGGNAEEDAAEFLKQNNVVSLSEGLVSLGDREMRVLVTCGAEVMNGTLVDWCSAVLLPCQCDSFHTRVGCCTCRCTLKLPHCSNLCVLM